MEDPVIAKVEGRNCLVVPIRLQAPTVRTNRWLFEKYLIYLKDRTICETWKLKANEPNAHLLMYSSGEKFLKFITPWAVAISMGFYRRFRVVGKNSRLKSSFKSSLVFGIMFVPMTYMIANGRAHLQFYYENFLFKPDEHGEIDKFTEFKAEFEQYPDRYITLKSV